MRQSNIEFRDDDDDDGSDGGLRNARGASLTKKTTNYIFLVTPTCTCITARAHGKWIHSHIAWHHTRHISNHRSSVTLLTCFGRYWRASELHGFYLTYASKIPSDLT